MIDLFHKRLPDWRLSGCNIKKALLLSYGLWCCDRLWMSSPQKISEEGGGVLCLWPQTQVKIQFCFSAHHSHHFLVRTSMGCSCVILIQIHKSQWKQIFLMIPRSINCCNTYKLDDCLWQDALKCQCCHLKWNSGIRWHIGAILSYSVSGSSPICLNILRSGSTTVFFSHCKLKLPSFLVIQTQNWETFRRSRNF